MEKFTGIIQRVTYHNQENGWTVLKVSPIDRPHELKTVTVHQANVFAGATMEFEGEWVQHAKYGEQFKTQNTFERKPASASALEKYIGSGLIYGVGPKIAKRIVKHFGKETLDVFEADIERLTEVTGIAQAKLDQIKSSWIEHREIRNVMLFLQEYGVSTLFAVKIFKTYGNDAIKILKDNPYQLSKDIYGIGFFSADKIALSMGIEKDSPKRMRAAISHVLAASREQPTEQMLWDTYNIVREVEASFKCLKSDLQIRPVHHQKDSRVEAHIYLTTLAYQLVNSVRHMLKGNGINYNWTNIIRIMNTQSLQDIVLPMKTKTLKITTSSKPIGKALEIYKATQTNSMIKRKQKYVVYH